MLVNLEVLRKHLNIFDEDFTDDDNYIMALEEVAEAIVLKHIDYNSYDEIVDENGDIPAPIIQAILLLVGTYYNSRESVAFASSNEIPLSYTYLLSLYKRYKGE